MNHLALPLLFLPALAQASFLGDLAENPNIVSSSPYATGGDVILKAVNVQSAPVNAAIDLPCRSYTAETLCAPPEAVNTLDTPDTVTPTVTKGEVTGDMSYLFPAHSVTILRLHR